MATTCCSLRNLCCQTRAADAFPRRRSTKRKFSCTASSNGSDAGNSSSPGRQPAGLNEGVVERLRQAEEEAAQLRAELAEAQAKVQAEGKMPDTSVIEATQKRLSRITGDGMRREGLFTKPDENWLRESDLDFFARGPSEAEVPQSAEEATVVRRRLLIGIGLTVAAGAFAVIPTSSLRGKPSKPLFFYLVPLLKIQKSLEDAQGLVINAQWPELEVWLQHTMGAPSNARENLVKAFSSLEGGKQRDEAELLAYSILEYIAQADYNNYFADMGTPGGRGGKKEQQFVDFSLQSIKAAQAKLKQFLALMPAQDMEAAQQQVASSPF